MQRAQLPITEQLLHRTGQPAQNIELVDGLVDERASPFGGPASLDGTRIVGRGTVPFHVAIALQQLAQATAGDGLEQKLAGIIEAMLAHHAQHDAAFAGCLDHGARGFHCGRDRLLHLHVLLRFGADLKRLEPEVGERADVHIIDLGMAADLLVAIHELETVLLGELAAGGLINVRTHRQLVPDVPVRLGVLVRNRARPDHSYSQRCLSLPELCSIAAGGRQSAF